MVPENVASISSSLGFGTEQISAYNVKPQSPEELSMVLKMLMLLSIYWMLSVVLKSSAGTFSCFRAVFTLSLSVTGSYGARLKTSSNLRVLLKVIDRPIKEVSKLAVREPWLMCLIIGTRR